jgi:hypothetical protein
MSSQKDRWFRWHSASAPSETKVANDGANACRTASLRSFKLSIRPAARRSREKVTREGRGEKESEAEREGRGEKERRATHRLPQVLNLGMLTLGMLTLGMLTLGMLFLFPLLVCMVVGWGVMGGKGRETERRETRRMCVHTHTHALSLSHTRARTCPRVQAPWRRMLRRCCGCTGIPSRQRCPGPWNAPFTGRPLLSVSRCRGPALSRREGSSEGERDVAHRAPPPCC